MKSRILCTWKTISGECEQCPGGFWGFEGWDNTKRYRDLMSGKAEKLCKRCVDGKGGWRISVQLQRMQDADHGLP
jgi:hypothetical protein